MTKASLPGPNMPNCFWWCKQCNTRQAKWLRSSLSLVGAVQSAPADSHAVEKCQLPDFWAPRSSRTAWCGWVEEPAKLLCFLRRALRGSLGGGGGCAALFNDYVSQRMMAGSRPVQRTWIKVSRFRSRRRVRIVPFASRSSSSCTMFLADRREREWERERELMDLLAT